MKRKNRKRQQGEKVIHREEGREDRIEIGEGVDVEWSSCILHMCETVKENYLNNKDYKIIEIPDSP